MSADDAFQTLKTFFETRQAARAAMSSIQEGREIGIVIADSIDCALYREQDQPVVERRPAKNPDVVFHIRPESVYVLAHQTKDEIGDIGVAILKEILAGSIMVRVPGGVMNVVRSGYLDMVRKGGAPVASFLGRHGFGSVPKIINSIKAMRR